MKKLVRPKKRQFGQYFTPQYIAKFIVENTVGEGIEHLKSSHIDTVTILDPSVGQGVFLLETLNYLEDYWKKVLSNEVPDDLKKKIVVNQLFGFDIDEEQVITTRNNLGYSNFSINIKQTNALIPFLESSYSKNRSNLYSTRINYKKKFMKNGNKNEKELLERIIRVEKETFIKPTTKENSDFHTEKGVIRWTGYFPEIQEKFNMIIGNPPWGVELAEIKDYLYFYNSTTPQIDSWVMFIELSLNSLKNGGFLGFVIPNTILQNPNYKGIRRMILDTCQITHLVNLGEGIFPGVSQPCMIIIAKKIQFSPSFKINVIPKISKHQRALLEEGTIDIEECESFTCSQSRFINNPQFQYDIWAVPHSTVINLIEGDMHTDKTATVSLKTLVTNSRGVEIGRKGIVVKCDKCGQFNSPPKKKKTCSNPKCHNQLYPELEQVQIVRSIPAGNEIERPFLAGYQIQRYYTLTPVFINSQYRGINYKSPNIYVGPKLLVRKTGSQMNWVIDYSDNWVSQVVYIFKLREGLLKRFPSISLEYLLGILNSDLMNFYVHSKFYEKERKDFPHLIQSSLLELPIRVPQNASDVEIVTKIVTLVTKLQKSYQELFNRKGYQLKQEDLTESIVRIENNLNLLINQMYKIPKDSRIL